MGEKASLADRFPPAFAAGTSIAIGASRVGDGSPALDDVGMYNAGTLGRPVVVGRCGEEERARGLCMECWAYETLR